MPEVLTTRISWPVRIHWQMRRLKAAELALAIAAPRLHASLRAAYDAVGPRLATLFSNRFAADFAYLLLKPAEWLAYAALSALVPKFDQLASRLYGEL
jgi:hypothetical protein